MTCPLNPPAALLPTLLWGLIGVTAPAGCSKSPPPNVLLISIDTLRADHLGCYGYPRATSPAIDRLAAAGVVFEDAWSTTSWTLPAHLSLLTGLPVSVHTGCSEQSSQPAAHPEHSLRGNMVCEAFDEAGFQTAGFYSAQWLGPEFGFGRGFGTWQFAPTSLRSDPELFARFKDMKARGDREGMRAIVKQHPELFRGERAWADRGVDLALDWLDARDQQRPFFLFLHLFDVHDPYLPPPPFDRRFDPDYTGPIDGRELWGDGSRVRADMSPRDLEHVIALYDGEIAAVDVQIGRLIDSLEQRGLSENTLVILTSDHGEEFFEHGLKLHRVTLYRESAQVPLILRWPRGIEPGKRIAAPVSLIDVVPTLRAAADLGPRRELPGVDLLAVARGAPLDPRREVLSELQRIYDDGTKNTWTLSLVDAQRHTLVEQPGTPQAVAKSFDRKQDPLESMPPKEIPWDSPEGVQLSARLDALRLELRALRGRMARHPLATQPLDSVDRDGLLALGYAGGLFPSVQAADRELPLCMDGCVWRP